MNKLSKKLATILVTCSLFVLVNAYAQKEHKDEHAPKNLQVLPKDIDGEVLHKTMRDYCISLGVRCNYCHEKQEGTPSEKPRLDFASDVKKEKIIARGMIKMVDSVNHMLDMIGNNNLAHITCVTCHNGKTTPMVSVDSFSKQQRQ